MAGKKRFVDSMDDLLDQTPDASIKGRVVVDQVYAHYQHENPQFKHPQGGSAFYLRDPLFIDADDHMKRLAQGAITPDGVDLQSAMVDVVEDLSREVEERAPIDMGDLKHSGQPIVEVDGEETYHRQPIAHRLSEEQLRMKAKLKYLFKRKAV